MQIAGTRYSRLRRPVWQHFFFLSFVGIAIFVVPYSIPVVPSISLSYIVGFNNHAAVIALMLGISLFAFFTRGELAVMEQQDSTLPLGSLLLALVFVLLCALASLHGAVHGNAGQEAYYNLNRQELLAAGLFPYRQFEYLYGPFLLYPGVLIARLLHLSQPAAYYTWWVLQWLIGTFFIWAVVRALDLNLKYRLYLFAFLVMMQCSALPLNGANYTPFRGYAAAFFVLVPQWVWKRSGNSWLTSAAALLSLAFALAVSMEQATGTAAGIAVSLAFLALSRRSTSLGIAFALYLCGAALLFLGAAHFGMFFSPRSFASGGLCFPLLPSVATCLILFIYIVAGVLLYGEFRANNPDSALVPLGIAGMAMLPSALGRCDLGHLLSATPIMVMGMAGIAAMPSLRRWWFPLFILVVILIPSAVQMRNRRFVHRIAALVTASRALPQPAPTPPSPSSASVRHVSLVLPLVPLQNIACDRTYFTISVRPAAIDLKCLDTGYYLAMQDVATEQSIRLVIDEMRQHASQPLLLYATPLQDQIILGSDYETNPDRLYFLEGAFAVPRVKNQPVTLEPIIQYIQTHYTPGRSVSNGQLRIWYPTSTDH